MLNKSIKFQNFLFKKNTSSKKKIFKLFNDLVRSDSQILSSMGVNYKDSYTKKLILGLKKTPNIDLVGMGGSVLGAKAIYKFLKNPKKKI